MGVNSDATTVVFAVFLASWQSEQYNPEFDAQPDSVSNPKANTRAIHSLHRTVHTPVAYARTYSILSSPYAKRLNAQNLPEADPIASLISDCTIGSVLLKCPSRLQTTDTGPRDLFHTTRPFSTSTSVAMPYATINNHSLHYTIVPPASSPPKATLFFVHGLGSTSSYYYPILPYLTEYNCVLFDNFGAGRSETPGKGEGTSVKGMAEDVLGLMREVGVERGIVVG